MHRHYSLCLLMEGWPDWVVAGADCRLRAQWDDVLAWRQLPGLPLTVRHGAIIPGHGCQLISDEARRRPTRGRVIRRTYSQFGDRCFATACPKLWNSLPVQLIGQADVNYEQFKRLLKTFLVGLWDRGVLCHMIATSVKFRLAKLPYLLTYLLTYLFRF